MSYREPCYLIELVAAFCALPLLVAYRIEGGAVGPPETLASFALGWAVLSAARTFWARTHRHRRRVQAA